MRCCVHKAAYLNPPFFLARAAFYFVVWVLLAHFAEQLVAAPRRGHRPRARAPTRERLGRPASC